MKYKLLMGISSTLLVLTLIVLSIINKTSKTDDYVTQGIVSPLDSTETQDDIHGEVQGVVSAETMSTPSARVGVLPSMMPKSSSPSPIISPKAISASSIPMPQKPIESARPTRDPMLIDLPEELKESSQTVSVNKGTISFTTQADWGEADKHLVWGNYNGRDIKNLFLIAGSGNILVFDIYQSDGITTAECNIEIADTTNGSEYKIKLEWDFEAEMGSKKVYVDNVLQRECSTVGRIDDVGGKLYTGKISNFLVSP